MTGWFKRNVLGDGDQGGGWSDLFFRVPPKHPDSRDIFLGGAGLITAVRGVLYLFGAAPQAELFKILGPLFTTIWSVAWIVVGGGAFIVACTGHRWVEVDRLAGFGLMMIWWLFGLMFVFSIFFESDRDRLVLDLTQGFILIITGMVLAAGVVQGIRKTQEINLRKLAVERIRSLERDLAEITSENQRLRREAGEHRG